MSCEKWTSHATKCLAFTAQWWFIPLPPASDTWRVRDSEETLNCWKIEVKSSRVVLSYRVFECSTAVYEGQVFLVETCRSPKRQIGFEKQMCGRSELEWRQRQPVPAPHWERLCVFSYYRGLTLMMFHFPLVKAALYCTNRPRVEKNGMRLQKSQKCYCQNV